MSDDDLYRALKAKLNYLLRDLPEMEAEAWQNHGREKLAAHKRAISKCRKMLHEMEGGAPETIAQKIKAIFV